MKRSDYLERILKSRVYDVASESPLELAPALSKRIGSRLLLKREDLHPIFSFKLRGAYNKMALLPRKQLRKGVIAASAGNHAQGVALAAQKLGCRAVIVMPVTTPRIKVDAVAARGARVVLHGDSYSEAYAQARRLQRRGGFAFVHPYDDPDVIAGQGTIGMEILRQARRPIHVIFVPVGGGGLIAGIAAYVKRLRPSVRIVGVEPDDADAMARSLERGARVQLGHVGLFADGVYGDGWNGVAGPVRGLFYGDAGQFVAECVGVIACCVFVFVSFYVFFKVVEAVMGNRVPADVEIERLVHALAGEASAG